MRGRCRKTPPRGIAGSRASRWQQKGDADESEEVPVIAREVDEIKPMDREYIDGYANGIARGLSVFGFGEQPSRWADEPVRLESERANVVVAERECKSERSGIAGRATRRGETEKRWPLSKFCTGALDSYAPPGYRIGTEKKYPGDLVPVGAFG